MDMAAAAQTLLSQAKLPGGCSSASLSPPIFHSKAASVLGHSSSVPFQFPNSFSSQCLQGVCLKARKKNFGAIYASETETTSSTSTVVEERWVLEPVGDGDSRHIGFKVAMPDAFEIASAEVTVGRLPEKADMVIPVATVSGVHARIRKKGGNLLVTDLDSTNGTFIGEKRLRPGVAVAASSGSYIIFGDIHLAMFRASKLENVEDASNAEESEGKGETETESNVTTS